MFATKSRVIVGLTTYYNENLMISLSGLSRLGRKLTLIIHNDNPVTKITMRQIRRMGYKGKLHIINSQHNIGLLNSRLAIIEYVKQHRIKTPWFVFADDDDILLNIDIPNVRDNHFAIIQNMIVLRARLIDVFRAIQNPDSIVIDGQDNILVRPHLGMSGTLVRTSQLFELYKVFKIAHKQISDITEGLGFMAPIDMMMWSALNIIARDGVSDASPIYMDTVNYIATDIDNVLTKYGMLVRPTKDAQSKISAAIARCDDAIRAALSASGDTEN